MERMEKIKKKINIILFPSECFYQWTDPYSISINLSLFILIFLKK